MSIKMIVGMQWGDEGKGKVIDQLCGDSDYVVRFQGGSNAGHTVAVDDKVFKLHLLPSGILRPGKICVVGNGVVVDPEQLLNEIYGLRESGVPVTGENLKVSDRAHLVFPYHKLADEVREEKRGLDKLGTTKRGIGPAYSDKAARLGLRVCDLYQKDYFARRVRENVELYNDLFVTPTNRTPLEADSILDSYFKFAEALKPFVTDTVTELNRAAKAGKSILCEGAQGAMLDIDFGTYPYSTSSNASCTSVYAGTGLPLMTPDDVIGICKAYTTRVGTGPFPTELHDAQGDFLREEGSEYGTTTGRPRRCGWLDMVVVRYVGMISSVSSIAVTKLDVLNKVERIQVCTGYRIDGKETQTFPAFVTADMDFQPIYQEFPGWMADLSGIKNYADLPANARAYIETIEEMASLPVALISTGPKRGQTIFKD